MSCLDFRVREAPVFSVLSAQPVELKDYKALVREDNDQSLAIVGKDYKVIQNDELFSTITENVQKQLGSTQCEVKDSLSHGGRICYRELTFEDLTVPSTVKSKADLHFNIVLLNSFGHTAIKIIARAIDFFCTNGMIIDSYIHHYWRHSKNLKVLDMKSFAVNATKTFAGTGKAWHHWQQVNITPEQAVQVLKEFKLSKKLQKNLLAQFEKEVDMRGQTLWALYSALTYYASHNSSLFPLRHTGVDHEATTLYKRSLKVQKWTSSEPFLKLAA